VSAGSPDLEPTPGGESARIPEGALYVTAEQLAHRYQVTTPWVYEHSESLGGTPLSDSRAARKRFHLPTADAFMASRRETPSSTSARRFTRQPEQRSHTPAGAPLISFR
jgi:hypothetical protein